MLRIKNNNNILDLIDTIIEFEELTTPEPKTVAIAFNKGEWVQLINIYKLRIGNFAALDMNPKEHTSGMYKGIYIYYDGSEDFHSDYADMIAHLRSHIHQYRNERMRNTEVNMVNYNNVAEEEAVERIRIIPTPPRARAMRATVPNNQLIWANQARNFGVTGPTVTAE